MKIALVDDEKAARLELMHLIEEYFAQDVVFEYTCGKDFIKDFNKQTIDLAFIDIHLGDIDGLLVAQIIKEINPQCKIVFVSAYDQYALDSYEIGIFDYLTKPLLKERFALLVNRIEESITKNNVLTTTYHKKTYFIDIDSIVYVESLDRKTWIYTIEDTFETIEMLSELEKKLGSNFFKCHKSYLININYLLRLEYFSSNQYDIILKNYETKIIPLSRHKVRDLKQLMR